MNNQFDPMTIRQGTQMRREREETPQDYQHGKARMAGDIGERALEMMRTPGEAERVSAWNSAFQQTNQGMEFNAAKMRMMEMQYQTALANAQAAEQRAQPKPTQQQEKQDDQRSA